MVKKIFLSLASLCWTCAWAQAVVPVIKVGDVAVFTVIQRTENKTSEETVTVTAVDGLQIKSTHVRPDWNPREREGIIAVGNALVLSAASGSRFEPPIELIKVPLVVGTAWKSSYQAISASSRSKGDLEFKVVGTEKLTTPAGMFDTFKLDSSGWITGVSWQGSIRIAQTLWFSPTLDRFIKTEYKDFRGGQLANDILTELKSFKPAP